MGTEDGLEKGLEIRIPGNLFVGMIIQAETQAFIRQHDRIHKYIAATIIRSNRLGTESVCRRILRLLQDWTMLTCVTGELNCPMNVV